jgi:hypothetical protein
MQQMTEWLTELGLGRNAQLFGENGIDCSVLPYLADQDLEKLGVRQCAIALCKTLEDAQRLFPCLHDQFYCNLATGHLPIALRYARALSIIAPTNRGPLDATNPASIYGFCAAGDERVQRSENTALSGDFPS